MAEVGIVAADERVELIEREICEMLPSGGEHRSVTSSRVQGFVSALGARAFGSGALPLRLDALDEPEPDVRLLRPRADRYRHSLPTPADTLLVAGVANASLDDDRSPQAPRYAAAAVPQLRIVALVNRRLEVHRGPRADGFAEVTAWTGGTVAPAGSAAGDVAAPFA